MPTERAGVFTNADITNHISGLHVDPKISDASLPKFSIIIPSYNQARFLERTLLSIFNQNYPNLEVILMDGASTDGSLDIIRKYEAYLTEWVSSPDKGQANAINQGFQKATGDLVMWQNSDDLYMPNFFHHIAASYRASPDKHLFIANTYNIDAEDRILWATHFLPFRVEELIYYDWNVTSQSVFITRSLLDRVGLLREDLTIGFDWEWFIRIGKLLKPQQTLLQRYHGGGYRIHEEAKLSRYAHETRWQIEQEILRSFGIRFDPKRPYTKQLGRWKWHMRNRILRVLLYRDSLRLLRQPLIAWWARQGIICEGF